MQAATSACSSHLELIEPGLFLGVVAAVAADDDVGFAGLDLGDPNSSQSTLTHTKTPKFRSSSGNSEIVNGAGRNASLRVNR
jgi:hypothetical protein